MYYYFNSIIFLKKVYLVMWNVSDYGFFFYWGWKSYFFLFEILKVFKRYYFIIFIIFFDRIGL